MNKFYSDKGNSNNTHNYTKFYDNNLNNQLLEGFEILARKYEKGDSIVAIVPSKLLFEKRGSFINKIPPYTPAIVNLRID